ncbi:DNA repair protein RadC [uncultured Dialister sp.]|uniref:RadC family protein n=1 Tax=uncultured Dialister sp. TaxID=278064 RepID=UPI0025D7F8B8|nr:DNA repair protein RadC [uncultured Dialister sp.]
MLIREMRTEDKPRERFAQSPSLASNTDLVAILLRTGRQGHSVMEIAKEVVDMLETTSGINGYEDLNWRDLTDIKGIGPDKAITICAAVELGRRLSFLFDRRKLISFNTPDKVADFFMEKLRHENQEHFLVSYVNVKNRLLGFQEITKGNLNAAPVDIKEAMKWGIRYKAYGLILVHNHPSGYPEPSKEDISVTKAFAEASKLLDMQVLDHIIIGDGTFVSLHERGCL